MILALVGAGALLLAAIVPGPWRDVARAVVAAAVVLSPVGALAAWISTWERAGPGTWLMLLPAAFTWLAFLDLRFGISARLARPPARVDPVRREAAADEDEDESDGQRSA